MHLFHHVSDNAIVHIDADAFFASCEQAINPAYRGKPVVTGKERGIVAAASYEAKKYGVQRGISLKEVRKLCPQAIILPSSYETYSLFSKRMFDIMHRVTSLVEEYSIDEGFVDITGLRRPLRMSYPAIAYQMKQRIESELGITVSVGLAPTKVLAKIATKYRKPAGFTFISHKKIAVFEERLPLEEVWGIGHKTASYLKKYGITTALQFSVTPFEWVKKHLTKPHQEIWQELNGQTVYEVNPHEKDNYASISKTKTFKPPSSDENFVLAQLSKNIENACIKARRHKLAARGLIIFLKTQEFDSCGIEARLNRPTCYPTEILPLAKAMFHKIFARGTLYRATGIILTQLQTSAVMQMSLFEEPVTFSKLERLYDSIDTLAMKYGKHTIFLGTSLPVHRMEKRQAGSQDVPTVKQLRSKQLNPRKFLNLPRLLGKVS